MKALVLTLAASLAVIGSASNAFSQAQIQFQNASSTAVYNPVTGQKLFGPAGKYMYGLYMGSSGATELYQMQLIDTVLSPNTPAATSAFAGIFSGGTVNSPGNVPNTLNFQEGTQYSFRVAVWLAADGNSFESAFYYAVNPSFPDSGISALGYVIPKDAPSPIAQLFGSGPGQIGGFATFAPEPSSLALGGLGLALLAGIRFVRRRKLAVR